MTDPIWDMMDELHERVEHLKEMGLIKEPPKSVLQMLFEEFEKLSEVLENIFYG